MMTENEKQLWLVWKDRIRDLSRNRNANDVFILSEILAEYWETGIKKSDKNVLGKAFQKAFNIDEFKGDLSHLERLGDQGHSDNVQKFKKVSAK
jgi:hypothetical protein